MCAQSDPKDLVITSYPKPCTDVNADDVMMLKHYQDTYMSICTRLAVKKAIMITHID